MTSIKAIKSKGLFLNYNEQHGLRNIINELTDKYPFIKKIILYGSKRRGNFLEDSDIDLLFIMDNDVQRSIKSQMSDIIYNHEVANNIVVSAIFISEADFKEKVNTFLIKVRKEGVILWSRE